MIKSFSKLNFKIGGGGGVEWKRKGGSSRKKIILFASAIDLWFLFIWKCNDCVLDSDVWPTLILGAVQAIGHSLLLSCCNIGPILTTCFKPRTSISIVHNGIYAQ